MDEDRNADLIGFEMEFEDGSCWRVTGTDSLLGDSYVRIEQTNARPTMAYTPTRIQTAQAIRQRKHAELARAGQGSLFDRPS